MQLRERLPITRSVRLPNATGSYFREGDNPCALSCPRAYFVFDSPQKLLSMASAVRGAENLHVQPDLLMSFGRSQY
jgi:hypothetical protein